MSKEKGLSIKSYTVLNFGFACEVLSEIRHNLLSNFKKHLIYSKTKQTKEQKLHKTPFDFMVITRKIAGGK